MTEDRDKKRLSRVVTRTGDGGETGLADGTRLSKAHPRILAMGGVDELNAAIGVLVSILGGDHAHHPLLVWIQHRLFDLGGQLAMPEFTGITEDHLTELESHCDILNAELPPLKEFVLPGGNQAGAWCHYCRTVTRRVETDLTRLNESEPLPSSGPAFINRLSDLLFMLARTLNRADGGDEPMWDHRRPDS